MVKSHLILGGARSGKSSYAEAQAKGLATAAALPLVYIATASAGDDEMEKRIARHQRDREDAWQLVEERIYLDHALTSITETSVVLIDCLTIWLSNCLHADGGIWPLQKQNFLSALESCPHHVLMVSNEVGHGIIPMGELTRNYVDEIGWLHQTLAQHSEQVTMVIAGLPQALK